MSFFLTGIIVLPFAKPFVSESTEGNLMGMFFVVENFKRVFVD